MSPLGQGTHIGLGKQTIWSTPVGASDYIKFSSETLTLAIEELISTSLGAKRDEPDSFEGLGTIAGDTIHEVHPNALGYLLRSWFGKLLSQELVATKAYKHAFTPGIDKEAKGTADSGSETTLVDADLVPGNDWWNGCWLHIISGTNAGEWRIITDSEASSNTVTVSPAFPVAIDNTSVYEIRNGPEHCILPPYTLEIHRDLPLKAFQFAGFVPNTLAFSFGVAAKILSLTASWLGKDVALIDPTSPSWESTEPFRWNQAILLVGIHDTGVSQSNQPNYINCVGKSYATNELLGKYLRITSRNMGDQIRKISYNSAVQIMWTDVMPAAPDETSTYEVWNEDNLLETLSLTLLNGLIGVPLLNNTKRIAKIVGDAFRTGTIAPTLHVEDKTNWETYFKGWTTRPWLVLFRGAALSGAAGYSTELQFHLPKVLFTAYPLSVAGPGRLTVGATGKIKYDSTSTYLAKVVLFNTKQSYA